MHDVVGTRCHPAGMKNGTTSAPAVLEALLPRQYRVISRSQAIACGLKPDMLQNRIRPAGPWQRLLPGVYLTVTGTPTLDQRDMAAILYSGPGSVITGAAALRRHGIRAPRGPNVDVLVPATRRRQSAGFVVVHLTTRVPRMVAADARIQFALPARASLTRRAASAACPTCGPWSPVRYSGASARCPSSWTRLPADRCSDLVSCVRSWLRSATESGRHLRLTSAA
jgi:hypothetical protein